MRRLKLAGVARNRRDEGTIHAASSEGDTAATPHRPRTSGDCNGSFEPGAARGDSLLNPCCPGIVCRSVVKFLLWCMLLALCWPLALLALVVYPLVWVLLMPFRLVGMAVDGVLGLLRGIVILPARLVRGPRTL